jgi:dipeptidyl aminopeptidase/acylaminoacyl peptidase
MTTDSYRLLAPWLLLSVLGTVLCGPTALGEEPVKAAPTPAKRFTLDHLNQIVRLSDPQIAPDGKAIALIVEQAETDTNRWAGELVLVEVATAEHRPLTSGRKSVAHPRWSPSGDRLAFLAPRGSGKEAARQVFTLPMNGGEAQPLTKSPADVQHFAWRPDGKEIAFAAADETANKKELEKGDDAFEVGNDDLFTKAAPMPVHIWLIPATGGDARRLTSGIWTLPVALPPSSPASPLSWSPDGEKL